MIPEIVEVESRHQPAGHEVGGRPACGQGLDGEAGPSQELGFRKRRGGMVGRAALLAENLALRQQLVVLQRPVRQPRLRPSDRIFWVWLSEHAHQVA